MLTANSASANVELIELKVEDNKIKIVIESRMPISFEYFTDEKTNQFGVNLSGADYYPDLIQYFQSIDIDSLSQCIDEIRIVPISVDSARFEVRLARDLVASVYDDTANSPKNFRVIIQFVAIDKNNSPCFDNLTPGKQFQVDSGLNKPAAAITLSEDEITKPLAAAEAEQASLNERQDNTATAQKSARQRHTQNQLNYTAYVLYDVLAYVNKGGYSDDDWLKQESQAELREAIVGVDGNYGGMQYQLALRSAKNKEQNQFVSVYRASIGYLTQGMAWEINAGMLLEPIGVESINYLDKSSFLERSVTSYLTNDYNPGVSLTYDNGSWLNWEIGVFSKRPVASEPSSEKSMASRVLLTPYREGAANLSIAFSYRDATPVDNTYAIAARPEMNLILPLFNVTQIGVETVTTTGASMLAQAGSFDMTIEVFTSSLNLLSAAAPTDIQEIASQSVSASWVFTGEQREITNGKRQRLIPLTPITLTAKGWGAWEASVRYSQISDDHKQKLTNATLAMAWYLNEHVEIKASWIFMVQSATTVDTVDNDADLIGLRFQLQY